MDLRASPLKRRQEESSDEEERKDEDERRFIKPKQAPMIANEIHRQETIDMDSQSVASSNDDKKDEDKKDVSCYLILE